MSKKKKERKELKELEAYGQRVRRAPRVRQLPYLGWSVLLLPIDVFPSRIVARVFVGTMFGFKPDEVEDLQARRFTFDDEDEEPEDRGQERTWWVLAVRTPERWRSGASRG